LVNGWQTPPADFDLWRFQGGRRARWWGGGEHGDGVDCSYLGTFHARLSAVPGASDLANTCIHYACPTCLGEEGWEATHACQHLFV